MNELVVQGKDGQDVLNERLIDDIILSYEYALMNAQIEEKNMRAKVLEAMMQTNTLTVKLPSYTVSQVLPKDKIEFDKDAFIREQSEDVLTPFVDIVTKEEFDIEKFKLEQPEMYKKYTKTEETIDVNLKKLEKTLPTLFKKYATYIKSEGKVTLRIVENKKKEE